MMISHRLPKPTGPWFALLPAGALLLQLEPAFADEDALDQQLIARLEQLGFTGKIEASLEQRLGRPVDPARADLGRLLWFDTIGGLNNDNTCAGCHSPTRGFGDTQSIAIGVENNGIVGPDRSGPRNQRRTPMAINTAFYPNLMWNSRFASLADDPFDNRAGFQFPPPEALSLSYLPHLLVAQAFIPPTERVEVAGFDFPGDNFTLPLITVDQNGDWSADLTLEDCDVEVDIVQICPGDLPNGGLPQGLQIREDFLHQRLWSRGA